VGSEAIKNSSEDCDAAGIESVLLLTDDMTSIVEVALLEVITCVTDKDVCSHLTEDVEGLIVEYTLSEL
jgi:hypothetical protein